MKEHEYQCPYKSDPVQPNQTPGNYNITNGLVAQILANIGLALKDDHVN